VRSIACGPDEQATVDDTIDEQAPADDTIEDGSIVDSSSPKSAHLAEYTQQPTSSSWAQRVRHFVAVKF
jgi:hypothetical protein